MLRTRDQPLKYIYKLPIAQEVKRQMSVVNNGKVGIGTNSPAELLSLSGTSSGNLTETLAIRLHNTTRFDGCKYWRCRN